MLYYETTAMVLHYHIKNRRKCDKNCSSQIQVSKRTTNLPETTMQCGYTTLKLFSLFWHQTQLRNITW